MTIDLDIRENYAMDGWCVVVMFLGGDIPGRRDWYFFTCEMTEAG